MIPVVVLAGGKGTRMGGNKPFHPYGGRTLIETTVARLQPQALVCINAGDRGTAVAKRLESLDVPLIFDDELSGLGPLSGVYTALKYALAHGHDSIITAPCDMPALPGTYVEALRNAPQNDIVHFSGLRDYPLCGLWSVRCLSALRSALSRSGGGLAVMAFLRTRCVHKIAVREDSAFINVNTADLAAA